MAQTLPVVDRFMQDLPAPPGQRVLERSTPFDDFAASLSALSSFGAVAASGQPDLPTLGQAGTELTEVLPPIGSLPGQLPAVSGHAPELSPAKPPSPAETVRVVTVPGGARPEPPLVVSPAPSPPAPDKAGTPRGAAAPARVTLPPAGARPPEPRPWPMTQVLPVESTLAGNILPQPANFPVQRALAPFAPLPGTAEVFAVPPPADPGGERLTAVQRANIEQHRGQGQPLEPGLRQHFENTLGASLGDVRVHINPAANVLTQSLNAIAFASGPDVFFTQRAFEPHTPAGLGLLGHELAHVVQQQYGLPGDVDALRPAGDVYEREADRLAAQALAVPGAAGEVAPQPALAVQRAILGLFSPPRETPSLSATAPAGGAILGRARASALGEPALATGPVTPEAAEPAPVQRFGLDSLRDLARSTPAELPAMPSLPTQLPTELPSLQSAADRVSGLTDELPSPGSLAPDLGQMPLLAGGLPSLGSLGGLAQSLPSFGGLPSLDSLPGLGGLTAGLGGLADQLPAGLGDLPQLAGALPSEMPGLSGLAQSLGSPPGPGELPALGSLRSPEMPLAEGGGGLGQALGGAAQAGQEALGSILGAAPSAPSVPETPAAPALPSLEKLTEHVWKQVQHKLKVERERSRGLA
jgi:hypothetical protein